MYNWVMRPIVDIERVRNLYNRGFSAASIARELDTSVWRIYKLMKEHAIKRRTFREANRAYFLGKPLSFQIKSELSQSEQVLMNTGLMLYWSEGSKRDGKTVDLANSDPEMIQIFLQFLRKIYRVSEERLRILLYCYSNQSIPRLTKYWSNITGLPQKQFTKPYVRKDFLPEKTDRMPYGLVHVRYSDQRLLAQIMNDMRVLINNMLG